MAKPASVPSGVEGPRPDAALESTGLARLDELLEISQLLAAAPSPRLATVRVLELLQERRGTLSSGIMLLDDASGELTIEAGTGFDWQTARGTRYRRGEGITGLVVESGRPIVVPRVSHEPLFLNRTGIYGRGGDDISFICVPVTADSRPMGALGVSLSHRSSGELEVDARFFGIVASMLGQALRVHALLGSARAGLRRAETAGEAEQLDLRHIVGNSRAMKEVYQQIAQVASTSTTVLIRGESGTGKELVAQALHSSSPRRAAPFIKLNCGALPESLIESELFGYEAGAFTSARSAKPGRLELANGGTLLLDEVGELSLATQVKLLRVLQEWEFERVGGVEPIRVDVRLIAATNKDLEAAVKAGSFREDLYYRLDVFSLFLPPLRERRSDVLLLADHFVEKYATSHGKEVRRIATTAIDAMMSYHWPGNVRELENCIERAVVMCEGAVVHAHHLPPSLQTAELSGTLPEGSLTGAVEAFERDLIVDALKATRGNRTRAAKLLASTERVVSYKAQKYGIDASRFKPPRGRRPQ
jgi:Nif-specific regulatory protein